MRNIRRWVFAATLTAVAAGCSGNGTGDDAGDARRDSGTGDARTDAVTPDDALDVASSDAPSEAATDAAVDVATDAPDTAVVDAGDVTPPDADVDADMDADVDAGMTDADVITPPDDVPVVDSGDAGVIPPGESCTGPFNACTPVDATGGSMYVRLMGTVVTPDQVYCDGEVLFSVSTGRIVCAGADCSSAPEASGAQVVCADGVIYPGLIDPHQHADYNHMPVFQHAAHYDNRNTWRNHEPLYDNFKIPHRQFGSTMRTNQLLSERYAEVRMVMSGVTSVCGTAGNLLSDTMIGGWVRNVDSRTAANSGFPDGIYVDPDTDAVVVSTGTGAVSVNSTATHLASTRNRMTTDPKYRSYVPHLSEGIDTNARLEFDSAASNGVVGNRTGIVHCTACSTQQLAVMGAVGAKLIWSPRSNIDLYGQTASVTTAHELGVPIALGVDWTPSGSMNPIGELQCAAHLNSTYYANTFTDAELVRMSTENGAVALNLGDQLGKIAPGYWADLTVISGDRTRPFRALIDAQAQQVRLVVLGGTGIYGDPDALTGAVVRGMACMAVPDGVSPDGSPGVCGTPKTICTAPSDIDMLRNTMTGILQTAQAADTMCSGTPTGTYCYAYQLFPLFRCGGGPELDRCDFGHPATPRRDTGGGTIPAVPGVPMPGTDDDGDGVANATDNCPSIFNPAFDLNTMQDDVDGDGLGDPCDPQPCTRSDGSNACVTDTDGDGVIDAVDNCLMTPNANQADGDNDRLGDLCDACPADATNACALTVTAIPTVRNPSAAGHPGLGTTVLTSGVVTAVKSAGTTHGFFLQDASATAYAGIYVYVGSAALTGVTVGSTVSARGVYTAFRGLEQIDETMGGGMFMVTGTGTVPNPIDVANPADIATGGAQALSLQSMLVRVSSAMAGATLTAVGATVATDFTVNPGSLIVTSFVANDVGASPFPATAGQTYTSITGVVYSFGPTAGPNDSKLAPRNSGDIVSP